MFPPALAGLHKCAPRHAISSLVRVLAVNAGTSVYHFRVTRKTPITQVATIVPATTVMTLAPIASQYAVRLTILLQSADDDQLTGL
jgi:hypothetical protein